MLTTQYFLIYKNAKGHHKSVFTQATTHLFIVFLFQHLPLSEVMLTVNKDLRNTRQKLQELKGHIEGPKCATVKEVRTNALLIEVYDFQLSSLKHLVKGTGISIGVPQSLSSQNPDLDKTPYSAASHTPPQSPDGAEGSEESSKSKYTSVALADKKQKALSHLTEKSHHVEPQAGNASADAAAKSVSGKDEPQPNPAVLDTSPPDPSTDPQKMASPSPQSDSPSSIKVKPQPSKSAKGGTSDSRKAVKGATGMKGSDVKGKSTDKPQESSPPPAKAEPDKIPDAEIKSKGRTPSTKDEPKPKTPKTPPPAKHEKESRRRDGKGTDPSSARKVEPASPHKTPGKRETPEASVLPPKPKRTHTLAAPNPMSFHSINSSLTVHVLVYDITALKVEAIVNAANIHLKHSGGVAKVISEAAGKSLEADCKTYIKTNGPLKVTFNMVSSAGNLPCKSVIHAAGPAMNHYKKENDCFRDVHETFANMISTATSNHFLSLGIPAISSGKLNILS